MTTCQSLADRSITKENFGPQANTPQCQNTSASLIKTTVECSIQADDSESHKNLSSSEAIQLPLKDKKNKNKKNKKIGQYYETPKNQIQHKEPYLREEQDTKSTDLSEMNDEIEQNPSLMTKDNRKKSTIDMSIEDEDQEETLKFLKGMNVNDKNRTECRLESEFLEKIRLRIQKVSKKPKQIDQFSVLQERLNQMEPPKRIFEKFKQLY